MVCLVEVTGTDDSDDDDDDDMAMVLMYLLVVGKNQGEIKLS